MYAIIRFFMGEKEEIFTSDDLDEVKRLCNQYNSQNNSNSVMFRVGVWDEDYSDWDILEPSKT